MGSRARSAGRGCVSACVVVCALAGLSACTNTAQAVTDLPAGYWTATERLLWGLFADVLELARLLLPL